MSKLIRAAARRLIRAGQWLHTKADELEAAAQRVVSRVRELVEEFRLIAEVALA